MVNIQTKADKHRVDNEKRRQSIKEKQKDRLNQSQIIKQALLNADLNTSCNNKIVFDNGDHDDDDDNGGPNDNKRSNGGKNSILFGDSESEEEEAPVIKEKIQFRGKKGFKLLNLQSTYGNDERFKIDERFLEEEKEESVVDDDDDRALLKDETDTSREKKEMLDILGSVLGDSFPVKESAKIKKRHYDMIRYDASKKEHEMYEIKPDLEASSSFKKKKLRKLIERDEAKQPKPEVSQKKFYEISREIKNSFKEKEKEGQFSLLQNYGESDVEDELEAKSYEGFEVASKEQVESKRAKESEQKVKLKEDRAGMVQGIWKETFFFEENDPRFKDCLEFINKKNSVEAAEAAENFDQTRKRLKEILRLHMKKQLQKKDPFRNKVGGGNKKQLVKSKPKSKILASKKKPLR